MDKKTLVLQWFRFAQDDFDSAKLLLGEQPRFSEIICYHCQQSAEKDLKAFLVFNEIMPPKTHDLHELNILCREHHDTFLQLADSCKYLTPFSVGVKYPEEAYINTATILKSIKHAEEIKKMVREVVGY